MTNSVVSCLPSLVTASTLASVLIAFIVALIGYQQFVLARRRLRLDMFEKRFAVYGAVLEQLQEISRKQGWPESTDAEFRRQLETARFLFPPVIAEYMDRLRRTTIDFAEHSEAVAETRRDDLERAGSFKLKQDGLRHLRNEIRQLPIVFAPHLKIKEPGWWN